jgi:hypothetical protein
MLLGIRSAFRKRNAVDTVTGLSDQLILSEREGRKEHFQNNQWADDDS